MFGRLLLKKCRTKWCKIRPRIVIIFCDKYNLIGWGSTHYDSQHATQRRLRGRSCIQIHLKCVPKVSTDPCVALLRIAYVCNHHGFPWREDKTHREITEQNNGTKKLMKVFPYKDRLWDCLDMKLNMLILTLQLIGFARGASRVSIQFNMI